MFIQVHLTNSNQKKLATHLEISHDNRSMQTGHKFPIEIWHPMMKTFFLELQFGLYRQNSHAKKYDKKDPSKKLHFPFL